MFVNAFVGRKDEPSAADLAGALGPAEAVWRDLLAGLEREIGIDGREWKSYSPKAGWALRLLRGKRAIVYLSPGNNRFLASFALGDKAVAAARREGFPAPVLRLIDGARKYQEGTAVRMEVRTGKDAGIVLRLAAIKRDG